MQPSEGMLAAERIQTWLRKPGTDIRDIAHSVRALLREYIRTERRLIGLARIEEDRVARGLPIIK